MPPPAPTDAERSARQGALFWGATALALLALAPLAPRLAPLLPACPVRRWLALPCPGCGSGRALLALVRLDPVAALAANPLAALMAGGLVMGGLLAAALALAGRLPAEPRTLPRGAGWLAAAALAANWVYLWWYGS